MRALFVGDVHCVPEEIPDCQALLDYVYQVQKDEKVDVVCLIGDQTHGHGIAHLSVLDFWRKNLHRLSHQAMSPQVIVLVGNHDHAVGDNSVNSMRMIHNKEDCLVVDSPRVLGNILFCPYFPLGTDFVAACCQNPTPTVICHQTIAGAFYGGGVKVEGKLLENPEVADILTIPQKVVVCGHLHSPQNFKVGDKMVYYIGSPRWRTISDANLNRALYLIDFDENGVSHGCACFDTGNVCRQIKSLQDTPEVPVDIAILDPKHDWRIDIVGSAAWIEERYKLLARPGIKIRRFRKGDAAPRVKESEGMEVSFLKFVKGYQPRYGTSQTVLETMAKERLIGR